MGKPHKYAQATVTIETTLVGDAVGDVVRKVADAMKNVTVEKTGSGVMHLAIKSWAKVTQMSFDVHHASTAEGTRVSTEIGTYLTQQQKIFIFIPLGPKTMLAWKPYRQFIGTLAEAFKAADPAARTSIVEIPGTV